MGACSLEKTLFPGSNQVEGHTDSFTRRRNQNVRPKIPEDEDIAIRDNLKYEQANSRLGARGIEMS